MAFKILKINYLRKKITPIYIGVIFKISETLEFGLNEIFLGLNRIDF
jgi:hypothetical protein